MPKSSSRRAVSALNRLAVACRDEVISLEAAARILERGERRARLIKQARRRVIFGRDLSAGVVALGGVPATAPSSAARLSDVLRGVRQLLTGPHLGDAYAACARATEKTEQAYGTALRSDLPDDARFGIERQYVEIELDRKELRRLRWGASLSPLPGQALEVDGVEPERVESERGDEQALEVWSDDGGDQPRSRAPGLGPTPQAI
jgi:uncharacterized protein (TIGR02284 family)